MKSSKRFLMATLLSVCLVMPQTILLGQTEAKTSSPPTPLKNTSPTEKWEADIRAFEAADQKSPQSENAIVFIGSSTIRLWKSLKQDFPEHMVINRGFGGSQISDSVFFADRIVIPYKPKQIVIYAGSNDIAGGKTPEQVSNDFKSFVKQVRAALPETRISFMSIGPSPARWSQADKQQQANQLIKEFIRQARTWTTSRCGTNFWDPMESRKTNTLSQTACTITRPGTKFVLKQYGRS
jgi:hypothetical protein